MSICQHAQFVVLRPTLRAPDTAAERKLALRNFARLETPNSHAYSGTASFIEEFRLDCLAPEPGLEPTKLAFGGPLFLRSPYRRDTHSSNANRSQVTHRPHMTCAIAACTSSTVTGLRISIATGS
jgi:hypothetical protein